MKTFFYLALTVFLTGLSIYVYPQVITCNPPLPTASDAVVITFDATQGGGGLANYTGDVYAHTGVKIQGVETWQYVIGAWGNNTTQPKLTRTGTNTYTLSISPSIRSFYSVPSNKTITKMCFVFRSSTASQQTEDLFYDVYPEGLTVDIVSPSQPQVIASLNEQIAIQVSSKSATLTSLYIDNQFVTSTTLTTLNYNYTASQYNTHWIKATATNGTETVADSVNIFVRPAITIAELPAGVTTGVNYTGSSEVTFVLMDPPAQKQYVFVIGSFNNWTVSENCYMKRTASGQYYWLRLTGLDPDTEYLFQYFIDNSLRLADAYTEKVSDPWNDSYISSLNYPDLIPYPTGKTTGIVSTFKINRPQFTWNDNAFALPPKDNLVIYELLIRDFTAGDRIRTAMDSLDYLDSLGVNAIELMPFNEFEGNDSWGYNPSFYFATDKAYGTAEDYKRFIDACHQRGIAVIMDMVLNHSYGQSPMVQMYFDAENNQPSASNPWYNQTCPHQPWCWGYDFNHESPHTEAFVDRVLGYWLTEFHIDGFRFDFTKGFSNVQNDGWAYNSARIQNLKRIADHIWDVKPGAYVILEHLTENTEEKELAAYGMMLWGNMNYNYNEATMGWISNSNFSGISYKNRSWTVPHLIGYMESHDEERLMYKNLQWGNSSGSYNIKNLNTALLRQCMAAAFFIPVPGPKMIWQFGELGYDVSIDYNGRVGRKPIRWEYYNNFARRRLYQVYKALIDLKLNYPVSQTNDFTISLSGSVKSIHLNHASMNITIIGNFDVTQKTINPQFQQAGTWYDYLWGDSITVTDVSANITLQPGEYHVYTSVKLPTPYIVPVSAPLNSQYFQAEIFPNPADDKLNIFSGSVLRKVEIHDISGRLFMEIPVQPATESEIDVSPLKKGIYFIKLTDSQGEILVRKLVIN